MLPLGCVSPSTTHGAIKIIYVIEVKSTYLPQAISVQAAFPLRHLLYK